MFLVDFIGRIKKTKISKIDLVILSVLSLMAILLLSKIGHNHLPLSDFLAYRVSGTRFVRLSLPQPLMHPPFYSLIVGILELIPVKHSAWYGGAVINILFFVVSSYFYWKILNHFLNIKYSLLFFVVYLSNPLHVLVTLEPINMISFTALSIVVIYLRLQGRVKYSYLLAGLGYLVRFESVALLAGLIIYDLVVNKKNRIRLRLILYSFVPIVLWELLVLTNNSRGNEYIHFFKGTLQNFPNMDFLINSFEKTILSGVSDSFQYLLMFLFFGYVSIGSVFLHKRGKTSLLIVFSFWIIYLLLHVMYTDASGRFSHPLVWATYLLLAWPLLVLSRDKIPRREKTLLRLALLMISLLLTYNSLSQTGQVFDDVRYGKYEYRMVAEWMNNYRSDRNTYVFTLQPWITNYFNSNSKIRYAGNNRMVGPDCGVFNCLIENHKSNYSGWNYVVVVGSHTKSYSGYDFERHGGYLFRNFSKSDNNSKFMKVDRVESEGRWIEVFLYIN